MRFTWFPIGIPASITILLIIFAVLDLMDILKVYVAGDIV